MCRTSATGPRGTRRLIALMEFAPPERRCAARECRLRARPCFRLRSVSGPKLGQQFTAFLAIVFRSQAAHSANGTIHFVHDQAHPRRPYPDAEHAFLRPPETLRPGIDRQGRKPSPRQPRAALTDLGGRRVHRHLGRQNGLHAERGRHLRRDRRRALGRVDHRRGADDARRPASSWPSSVRASTAKNSGSCSWCRRQPCCRPTRSCVSWPKEGSGSSKRARRSSADLDRQNRRCGIVRVNWLERPGEVP